MIDIHSYALYDCDDGSENIEKSLEMIKKAKESGITGIFFTPHYMEDGYKNDKTSIYEKTDIIREELKKQQIDIELYNGEEVFIFPKLDEEIDDKIISLNNTRYVLIEFPLVEEVNYIEDVIYKLLSKGKVPIIAHPERYYVTEKSLLFVEELINKGALIQINVNSLTGCYGKVAEKLAKKLLEKNMVHFVASDAHSVNGYRKVEESLKVLSKLVDEEKYKEITYLNQQKIIQDEEIVAEEIVTEIKNKFFFINLFKEGGLIKCLKR